MADIEVYRQAWDDFLEAFGNLAKKNRELIDLVCDMSDELVDGSDETKEELLKRYREVMNLDG